MCAPLRIQKFVFGKQECEKVQHPTILLYTAASRRLGGRVVHYGTLVVAEKPLERHRAFLEQLQEEEEREAALATVAQAI